MTEHEKEPYHAEATVQQEMVESLAQKPLRRKRDRGGGSGASSHECDSQDHLENSVWRKAKKRSLVAGSRSTSNASEVTQFGACRRSTVTVPSPNY